MASNIKDFIRTKFPPIFAVAKIIFAILNLLADRKEIFIRNYFPKRYYKKKVLKDIKMFRYIIQHFENDDLSKVPGNIVVEINNTCNLNCSMCATQHAKRKKGEMSIELFEDVIKELVKLGLNHQSLVVHTVGEPLFYSNLPAIFTICKKYNFRLLFTTNGLLIHKHMNLIDLINQFPGIISSISFSIDGATKETYEKIRRGGIRTIA